tara:strand:+ start:59 stop:547 length:489 start_codon:yes stop_codon:yes gene_type:complete
MNNLLNKKSVLRVKEFLDNNNLNIKLIVLDETARTANDAANSLKKEVGAIVKSLLFKNIINNEYYLCLVSGDQYMSIKKLSDITKGKIVKANANECKEYTGFSIGGVSPFAHKKKPANIFIDKNLNKYESVYAAAGNPFVVFGITFEDLTKITNGKVVSIVE